MKKLPIGTQTFRHVIKKDLLYVDKTDFLIDLVKNKFVFLSHPRRFGKSLLLSAVEELFSGDEQLFEGLKISKKGYKFEKFPVIHLDMAINSISPDMLEKALFSQIGRIASKKKLNLYSSTSDQVLVELIETIYEKHGEKVVVLIDEYDDPVSANLDDLPLAEKNGEIMRAFYAQLKSLDEYLRFVFVTGVTRYAMMGLSSGRSQLTDISFDPKYAAICGFTLAEIDQYFGDRYSGTLEALKSVGYMPVGSSESDLRQKILDWYDGYTFDGQTRVLNPISLLRFFKYNKFAQHWLKTAPSTYFLSNIMEKNHLCLLKII